ncbi:MAG TPA: SLC13 family permease [Gammaproteobacteria bacterium]|nr:SLC13 family permease [Gammaproteobacteria bacterium]
MTPEITLTFDMALVLSIIVFTVLLTLSNVIRVDVVAVLVLVVLGITRLLPPEQLFSGFSNDAVMSLISVMIIGAGLEKSGIALRIARWILKLGRERPNQINIFLMFSSGFLSAFMRSLGTVALLLPVVTKITVRTGIPKSRLLMPIAFCSILGGTLTMIGSSPLILLNSLLKNAERYVDPSLAGLKPFHLFSVFPVGLMILLVGIGYLILFARRLLPKEPIQTYSSGTTKTHFLKTYGKGGDIFELKVRGSSSLIGLTLKEIELKLGSSSSVLALMYGKEIHFPPLRKIMIASGAFIAMMGHKETVVAFAEQNGLILEPRLNVFSEILHPVRAGLCEAVVPPSSQLIGLELRELHMKRTHELHVLAVYRGQTVYQGEELNALVLRSGDTLGMFCRWEALAAFHKNPDFVVVTTSYPREEIRPKKVAHALSFFILSILLIVGGNFPVSVALLLGAAGMIATGVLTIDEAYASVSWKNVFLIAGLIPLGLVMQSTHTTDWLTQHASLLDRNLSNGVIQLGLAFLSTVFGYVLSGVGATIVLVPIALELAFNVGADPRMYALIVAISASNAFLLPTQQANALIAGPGGYRTKDFLKVGGGMTILYWAVMLISINLWFAK